MLYPNNPKQCNHCIEDPDNPYYLCDIHPDRTRCTLKFVGLATFCEKLKREKENVKS